jgi:hypothetical protein
MDFCHSKKTRVPTRKSFPDIAVVAEQGVATLRLPPVPPKRSITGVRRRHGIWPKNVSERIRMHMEALNHALANISTEDLADQDICIVLGVRTERLRCSNFVSFRRYLIRRHAHRPTPGFDPFRS